MFPHEAGSKNGAFAEAGTRISGSGAFTVREAKASYQRVSRIRAKPPNEDESGGPPGPSDYEQPGALLELSASYESDGDLLSHKSSHEIWEGVVLAPRQEFRLVSLPLRTVTPVSHGMERSQLSALSEASITGFKHDLVALLQTVDTEIRDVQILSPKGKTPVIYIDYARVGLMPLSAFGDGVRRVLLIARAAVGGWRSTAH